MSTHTSLNFTALQLNVHVHVYWKNYIFFYEKYFYATYDDLDSMQIR